MRYAIKPFNLETMTQNRKELLQRISNLGYPEKEVALTLEEFFEGNNYEESIGVNLDPQPTPKEFYDTFLKLLTSDNVDKIYVRVTDIEDCEDWVYSDTIYVIGTLTKKELKFAIKNLHPDDITEGWEDIPENIVNDKGNNSIFTIWWD